MSLFADGVEAALGGRPVLRGVSAALEPGALIGVLGPNGAGKSTFARTLAGVLRPTAGRVRLGGDDLHALPPEARARAVAYLPQGAELHWPLTVERLVSLGRLPHMAPLSRLAEADRLAIDQALQETGTTHLRHRSARELSGGERARVFLARALATDAACLIADEPLTGLDPGHQLEAMSLLARQARAERLVVVILHDLALAGAWCDRLLLLHQGQLVVDGPPAEVLTDARLAEVYGVRAERIESGGRTWLAALSRT